MEIFALRYRKVPEKGRPRRAFAMYALPLDPIFSRVCIGEYFFVN